MEDDEISSPFRSPHSSGSPMSNTFNNLPRDEEDDEIPNSLAGSPSHGGSPVRSFEEAGDEEIDSLDQINGEEDEGDFIVNAIHSSSERGEEESSSPNHREDDEDFLSRSSKRRKSPPEDRISALPDNALLHILSFLPAESAIRTGILSKRWMNLWQVSPNLIFNYNGGRSKWYNSFVNFVNSTLILHSSPKIKKFYLRSLCLSSKDRYDCDPIGFELLNHRANSSVGSWLSFAIRHDVEELSLKFAGIGFVMPQSIFNCSSLRKLSSKCGDYAPKCQVSWGLLRKLSISHSTLTNDALQKILVGSPVLECLKLKNVKIDENRIDVSPKSSLAKLVIEGIRNFTELRISAPNLKSLEISGLWLGTKFVLLNASSLVNFHLELRRRVNGWNEEEEDFTDMIGQLLRQINHAEQLTLGSSCVEVLSMLEDTKLSSILADCNCKCLTLKLKAIRDGELLGITSLLCHLPTLEKLVAYFLPEELSPSFGPYRKVEDIWTSQGRRPFSPLLQHLKTVEFVGFVVRDGFFDGFVRFLLQNASVLDKMVVRAIPYVHPSYWYTLARTLLSIQKASPHAVVYLPVL